MDFAQKPVYILEALRTPIGKAHQGLKDVTLSDLAAVVTREGIRRAGLGPRQIGEFILGCGVTAGAGQNVPRAAALSARLDISMPAYGVGNVCASGIQALVIGTRALSGGGNHAVVAAAAESASHNPELLAADGTRRSSLQHDGLECSLTGLSMGRICEKLARRHGISRARQDHYALESHRKAMDARDQGKFQREIVPVLLPGGNVFDRDQGPRKKISFERLQNLPPAFDPEGSITAGNSSFPADGAGAVFLAPGPFLAECSAKPLARIRGISMSYVPPEDVFAAAVPAINFCCRQSGLSLKDIDLFEVCEAFAAQALWTGDQLAIPEERMNIFGGDIALGHPLGAAGLRCLVTLVHALAGQRKKYGIACVCFGGGGAMAVAVERVL